MWIVLLFIFMFQINYFLGSCTCKLCIFTLIILRKLVLFNTVLLKFLEEEEPIKSAMWRLLVFVSYNSTCTDNFVYLQLIMCVVCYSKCSSGMYAQSIKEGPLMCTLTSNTYVKLHSPKILYFMLYRRCSIYAFSFCELNYF